MQLGNLKTQSPSTHSASALVHTQAATLFTQLGNQDNLNFEIRHKAIIDRFGRYLTATPSWAAPPPPKSGPS